MQDNEPINLTYGQMSDMVNRIEQIPSLSGEGAPTTSTPAFHLGQTYIDTTTGDMYYCSSAVSESGGLPEYVWEPVAGEAPEYTAGDGINISEQDVISATNTGKAKVLTTDDYNWPTTGTKTSVALWLLPDGIYYVPRDISTSATSMYAGPESGFVLVAHNHDQTSSKTRLDIFDVIGNQYTYTDNDDGTLSSGGSYVVLGNMVTDNLSSTSSTRPLSAKQGKVLKDFIGDLTNLTTTDKTNLVAAINEAAAGGGGGGPTVVQTTGESTTDVMSQNAVTKMIYPRPSYNGAIQIGSGQNDDSGVSIFGRIYTNGRFSVAIGGSPSSPATVAGNGDAMYSVAIGDSTSAGKGRYSVAVGSSAYTNWGSASGNYAGNTAIGGYAKVQSDSGGAVKFATAIGFGARATMTGQMDISTTEKGNIGYNDTKYRLLTGLYDPQNDHDAATKGYVDPTTDSSAPTTATVGRLGQIYIDTSTATAYMCVAADTATPSYTWKQITA